MDSEKHDGSERLVAELLDSDVVERTGGPDEYEFTERFLAHLEDWEARLSEMTGEEVREAIHELTESDDETDAMLEFGPKSDRVAEYLSLGSVDAFSHIDRLRVLTVFDAFSPSSLPTEGTPVSFLPVDGARLPFLLSVCDRAVVYVWDHDCPPCDTMRNEFDEILRTPPDDLTLLAVYGPDSATLLQEEYNVVGGPTTLFVLGGRVDARLQGPQYRQVIETEIEKLREIGRSE